MEPHAIPERFRIFATCAIALITSSSGAQETATDLNARAAAERIGAALLAYYDMRMIVLKDTTRFNLCSTSYRSAVPLAAAGPERVSEVVGSSRRESCDEGQAGTSGAATPRVMIDSVTLSLTRATITARVRRGEHLYSEQADLETGRGLVAGRWIVTSIRVSDVLRLKG